MGFFVVSLFFYFILLLFFILTAYIYVRLALAVKSGQEVSNRIYKFGQAFRHKNRAPYDDITNSAALTEATLFIFFFILANILFLIVMYYRTHSFPIALYSCLKAQFGIAVVTVLLHDIIKFLLIMLNKSNPPAHIYSSSKAVMGAVFYTSFIFSLCIFMSGFPAEPFRVQVDNTEVIVGETKASELLSSGFTFYAKTPDTEIVNKRDDHFYYGESAELVRDGKSYGFVRLTPKWEDSDKLKNCIITFYGIYADNEQLSKVNFNNEELSKLTIQDFKTRRLIDIFSLNPVDYEEIKHNSSFYLRLQTVGYAIWKSYRIEADFQSNDEPYRYSVGAQHTIWE